MNGDGHILRPSQGSSSGGYLVWIMRYTVYHLYQINLSVIDVEEGLNGISLHPGRNQDFLGVYFTPPNHSIPTLKFAYAYGFRNIQNLVRKLKSSKKGSPPYHFVEVMACPSGCINGGGQVKELEHDSIKGPSKDWIANAETVYRDQTQRLHVLDPHMNQQVIALLNSWIGNDAERKQKLLTTSFHAVENTLQTSLLVKW